MRCGACGHQEPVWNPCGDRHCPSCMASSARAWVQEQEALLLPVPYFHLVFTLPRPIADLALYNKKLLYGLLMRVSAEVVLTIAADRKFLGGRAGFLSVLHTWSQRLEHHPHVHMVVPGGVLAEDDGRWTSSRATFFLPVRVLSALFRRRFLEELVKLQSAGTLRFQGIVAQLAETQAWEEMLAEARSQAWVVYAKPPFGGPKQVLRYLARYTHRVAISNSRLLDFDGERVTFRCRARRSEDSPQAVTLPLTSFMERFLLHVIPKGFVRIRHYGFLAPRARGEAIRQILSQLPPEPAGAPVEPQTTVTHACPQCGVGTREKVRELRRFESHLPQPRRFLFASTGPPANAHAQGPLAAVERRAA